MEFMTHALQHLKDYGFDEEMSAIFAQAADKILACPEAAAFYGAQEAAYAEDRADCNAALEAIPPIAQAAGIPVYTANTLLFLALMPRLDVLYKQRGYPREMLLGVAGDLICKARECQNVYGVCGSFVAWWHTGFFKFELFALGRLQFEKRTLPRDCEINGRVLPEGTPALNVHIPSAGPLTKAACDDAFAQAKTFFALDETVFMCDSWLLYPAHRDFLPLTSNILMFMDYFQTVYEKQDPEFQDAWRVFGMKAVAPYTDLPETSGLQRAYAVWLRSGHMAGTGFGIFVQ